MIQNPFVSTDNNKYPKENYTYSEPKHTFQEGGVHLSESQLHGFIVMSSRDNSALTIVYEMLPN